MISLSKKRRPASVLGLAIEPGRIAGVVVRRTVGGLAVQQAFQASLALDPLTADSELIGREIQNRLDEAGVRERQCVVSLPLNWALTLPVKLPAIPESEVASFIGIQAEKGFPYGPEDLSLSNSVYRSANGDQHATLVAVQKTHVVLLQKALQAARLKPLSFTVGATALQQPGDGKADGIVVIAVGEDNVSLEVLAGGGIAALRSLEGTFEVENGQRRIYADLVAREVKITLGQLPKELRETVRQVEVFGRGEVTERLVREITPRMSQMEISVQWVQEYRTGEFGAGLPAHTAISPALSVAARYLTGTGPVLEFLPPKPSAWPQLAARFASRRAASVAAIAGVIALIVGSAFFVQNWKLSGLESRWKTMGPKVKELEDLQQQIKKFRPWYDNSAQSLVLLRKLTEAFPQDGSVSVKTVEIRGSAVTCSGVAKDNPSFRKVQDQLLASKEIRNLKVDQLRNTLQGPVPLQFRFNFQWQEHGNEN